MNIDAEKAAVRAVLDAVRQGLHDKDAAAIDTHFAPGAVIFDLAPPLAHGVNTPGLSSWLETWDGPVEQEWADLAIEVSGELAVGHGLNRMSATTKSSAEQAQWWQRSTMCLHKSQGAWKIIHAHTSVPFHMDGSFRAAIDLQP